MGLTKQNLHKSQYPLIGFGENKIEVLGKIELNLTFSEGNTQRTEAITFDVVDINYSYNAIFDHNTIIKFTAVIHEAYLCMKLPTAGGSSRSSATKRRRVAAKTMRHLQQRMSMQSKPQMPKKKRMRVNLQSLMKHTSRRGSHRQNIQRRSCSARISQATQ